MFKRSFVAVLVSLSVGVWTSWSQAAESPQAVFQVEGMPVEVAEVMALQLEAWNAADLVGFMHGYWESDSLRFVGSSGVTRGHRATLERYIKGYPDAQAMGQLTFVNQEWVSLGDEAGWLLGSWHLDKDGMEDAQGMYTLLWRKLKGRWVIVADHSS
jgi:ketosteroid isomerase-like protein